MTFHWQKWNRGRTRGHPAVAMETAWPTTAIYGRHVARQGRVSDPAVRRGGVCGEQVGVEGPSAVICDEEFERRRLDISRYGGSISSSLIRVFVL